MNTILLQDDQLYHCNLFELQSASTAVRLCSATDDRRQQQRRGRAEIDAIDGDKHR